MKPIASPLNIIDFAVLNFELKYIQPKKKNEIGFTEHFKDYEIDIDFSIHTSDVIQVFLKAEINKEKLKKPGYSICAEVACIFEFNKEISITHEAKNAIEGFSTIYIALNSLRGFISHFSASGPIGRYILPSIDLNDLINKKKELISNDQTVKVNKVKSTKKKKMKKLKFKV